MKMLHCDKFKKGGLRWIFVNFAFCDKYLSQCDKSENGFVTGKKSRKPHKYAIFITPFSICDKNAKIFTNYYRYFIL